MAGHRLPFRRTAGPINWMLNLQVAEGDCMQFLRQAFRCGPILIGALTCSMSAYCRISSIPNIAKLTDSSTVIVAGEVLRVVQIGNRDVSMPDGKPYTCASMTAFIRVDEVLKEKRRVAPFRWNISRTPTGKVDR